MTAKRLDYLDMVKGIGIILVVVGHTTYVSEGVLTWLASFHMPLFFMISGMLFCHRDSAKESFRPFFRKRFCQMMIPYFWFSLIYIGVDYYYLFTHPEIMNQAFINHAVLQTVSLYGISVLWFLPAIFFGEILFYWIRRKCSGWQTGLLALAFVFPPLWGKSIVGRYIRMEDSAFMTWLGNLILTGLRVLPAVTFLAIGYYSYRMMERISLKRGMEILIGAGLMILNVAVALSNGRVDLHFLVFNQVFLYFLGAFSGTMGLVLLFKNCRRIWILSFLGCNSLIIMLTHLDCQVMSTAIRFAAGMNQFVTHAKDYIFQFNLYLALFIGEMVLIFLINRYFYFLIGRSRRVNMVPPLWIAKRFKKRHTAGKVVDFRKK